MRDQDFLSQFENCTLPKEELNHRGHLRVAWLYLEKYPLDVAMLKTTQGIIRFATSLGAAHIYHESLTRLWVYLVYQAKAEGAESFDEFMEKNAFLLDKDLPKQYYSAMCLESEKAKKEWVEPDLKSWDEI